VAGRTPQQNAPWRSGEIEGALSRPLKNKPSGGTEAAARVAGCHKPQLNPPRVNKKANRPKDIDEKHYSGIAKGTIA
jgi:hypothetical protein